MLIYFLPMIIILGFITSYSDITDGKIRNKWILLAICYGIIVNLILINKNQYPLQTLSNFLFCIILSIGIWLMGIWTPGDAKLFIAFSILIPVSSYLVTPYYWFGGIELILNIFIVGMIYMIFQILSKINKKNLIEAAKEIKKDKITFTELIGLLARIFVLSWFIKFIFSYLNLQRETMVITATTFILMYVLRKLLRKQTKILVFISILRLFIDSSIYSWEYLYSMVILIFVWRLLRLFITGTFEKLSILIFSDKIHPKHLKTGMFLTQDIIVSNEKINDQSVSSEKYYFTIKDKKKGQKKYINIESEGLSNADINKIRRIGFNEISVFQTIPFAPFIFIAVIITILINGNILIVLAKILNIV